jgi:hypothetical protein
MCLTEKAGSTGAAELAVSAAMPDNENAAKAAAQRGSRVRGMMVLPRSNADFAGKINRAESAAPVGRPGFC